MNFSKWAKFKDCEVEAKKYSNRTEFNNNARGCYMACVRNGWLEKVCSHMIVPKRGKWKTIEICEKEARKYSTRTEFNDKSPACYRICLKNKWLDKVCSHMIVTIGKWSSFKNCEKEASKYSARAEFSKNSAGCYSACLKHGWIDKVCLHMDKIKEKWTLNNCKIEGRKYRTRYEFQKKSKSCYHACWSNGWLEKVCAHMLSKKDAATIWTFEKSKKEALKYSKRSDFSENSSGCYNACYKNGWLDKVCSHMTTTFSLDETKIAQPLINKALKKLGLSVSKEFSLSRNSRVDFLCTNKDGRKIVIEVKSDKKSYSSSSLDSQISRYRSDGKRKFGNAYAGTFLVSPKGRYGYSIKELGSVLRSKGLV